MEQWNYNLNDIPDAQEWKRYIFAEGDYIVNVADCRLYRSKQPGHRLMMSVKLLVDNGTEDITVYDNVMLQYFDRDWETLTI